MPTPPVFAPDPAPDSPGISLVAKLTCGADDAERANQALTVATAAAAMGAPVTLWLTGEGVWFATTDRCPDLGLAHATPAAEMVATVAAMGEVVVCTQCAARRGLTDADLLPGARIAGAGLFAESVLQPGVQALVY